MAATASCDDGSFLWQCPHVMHLAPIAVYGACQNEVRIPTLVVYGAFSSTISFQSLIQR